MSVKSAEARAEVFWTAFRAMGREERHAFLERLLADEPTRRDLLDAALIEERKGEPRKALDDAVAGGGTRRRRRP